MKKPQFVIETPFFPSLSSLFINAYAMLSSFCIPCSIAVDWGVLFTNNCFIVFDGEVVGFRLTTLLHLDAVTLAFLHKNQSDSWLWSFVFFSKKFISSSVKFSFLFIPCVFFLISSTLGGGVVFERWCTSQVKWLFFDRWIITWQRWVSGIILFCNFVSGFSCFI